MSILDVIIILIILMFGAVGYKKGVIKEGVSLIGTILVFIISYMFKGVIGNELCKFLPFFNFSGKLEGLVSLNIIIYQLAGFFILFSVLFIVYHIVMFVGKVLQKIIDVTLILTIPSKLAGCIVGLVKGYIIIMIVLLVLVLPLKNSDLCKNSYLMDIMLYKTPIISTYTSDITNSISEVSDLVIKIDKKQISVDEANIEIVKSTLKYKVIDKHTLEQVIVLDKLKSVKGIDKYYEEIR